MLYFIPTLAVDNKTAVMIDWAPERVAEHYRKELGGQLGNLLSRISTPKLWNRFPSGLRSGTGVFYPPPKIWHRLPDGLKSITGVIYPFSKRQDVMMLYDRIEQLPGESRLLRRGKMQRN